MGKRKQKPVPIVVTDTIDISSNHSDSCEVEVKEEERPNQLPSVTKRAKRRKSKKEIDDEESSDYEHTLPRSFRSHLQKRRSNEQEEKAKLDSSTLEIFLEKLWKSFPEEKMNSFAYLGSLWYFMYTNDSYKEKVLSWIKKKKIFSKKYVFIPIIQWSHWSLLIFCNFGEDIQSKTTRPCMLLLDSMRMAEPKRLEPGIRKFVLDIYKSEERPEDKKVISKISLLIPKVPQQRNGEECGNYVLYYMNLFIESAPENFSLSEGYPYFMKKDWFTTDDLESFCKRLDSYRE